MNEEPISLTAEEMIAVLNERATVDPLIREIMRSTSYEAALRQRLNGNGEIAEVVSLANQDDPE